MRTVSFAAAVILAGCASAPVANRPLVKPDVRITQTSTIAPIATHQSGAVSVQFRVDVANKTTEAIRVNRVDLQSVGSGAYSLPLLSKPYALEIKPGASRFVEMSGPAYILDAALLAANGPTTIRLTLDYNAGAGPIQVTYLQQVFPPGD